MSRPQSPFESGLRLMEAQQQLATRSLINMIEMVSASSHRLAADREAFTREALGIMNEAAQMAQRLDHSPASLSALQQKWSATCLKYGQDQTRAAMSFVEQCGVQALNVVTRTTPPPPAGTDTE